MSTLLRQRAADYLWPFLILVPLLRFRSSSVSMATAAARSQAARAPSHMPAFPASSRGIFPLKGLKRHVREPQLEPDAGPSFQCQLDTTLDRHVLLLGDAGVR